MTVVAKTLERLRIAARPLLLREEAVQHTFEGRLAQSDHETPPRYSHEKVTGQMREITCKTPNKELLNIYVIYHYMFSNSLPHGTKTL